MEVRWTTNSPICLTLFWYARMHFSNSTSMTECLWVTNVVTVVQLCVCVCFRLGVCVCMYVCMYVCMPNTTWKEYVLDMYWVILCVRLSTFTYPVPFMNFALPTLSVVFIPSHFLLPIPAFIYPGFNSPDQRPTCMPDIPAKVCLSLPITERVCVGPFHTV